MTPTGFGGDAIRHEGPLAEFVALREEIQERIRAQQQLQALQLTVSAAVFGFAISRDGMTALLLIVPFSSYLLCARLVSQHFGILRVATYILEELSDRVPGGLRWEAWLNRHPRNLPLLGFTLPLLFTFAGASLLALGWTADYVFLRDAVGPAVRAGLALMWMLGLAVTGLAITLVLQMAGWLPAHSWKQTGPC